MQQEIKAEWHLNDELKARAEAYKDRESRLHDHNKLNLSEKDFITLAINKLESELLIHAALGDRNYSHTFYHPISTKYPNLEKAMTAFCMAQRLDFKTQQWAYISKRAENGTAYDLLVRVQW